MLLIVERISGLNMDALKRIYVQTMDRMDTDRSGSFGADSSADQCFMENLRLFFQIRNAKLYIWEDSGIPVAALRCEPYGDGVLISNLETIPEMRGRGYAKALLSAVIRDLRNWRVYKVYSHVGKRNKPSLSVHNFCGFQICSDYAKLLDGTVSQNYYTMVYKNTAE